MPGVRKAEARRWFQQAAYDLEAARWNVKGAFYDTACFLTQQAGEKALKSFLYYLGAGRAVLMTHSLVEMIEAVGERVGSLPSLLHRARQLDLHYIPSRYPNGLPSGYPHRFYGREVAEEAVRAGESILSAVRDYYKGEGEEEILRPDKEGAG
jgi:HEPN domain-containing protein